MQLNNIVFLDSDLWFGRKFENKSDKTYKVKLKVVPYIYKQLYYLSAAEQKIAIILEDNILWQRLPAERNPGDFYQIQIFDALEEEDTKLKTFCEFLIARRMFHLNQAYAHKTEHNWREHIVKMYSAIKKVQGALGFDVRANCWHEEELSMYDAIENALDLYETKIAKDLLIVD